MMILHHFRSEWSKLNRDALRGKHADVALK